MGKRITYAIVQLWYQITGPVVRLWQRLTGAVRAWMEWQDAMYWASEHRPAWAQFAIKCEHKETRRYYKAKILAAYREKDQKNPCESCLRWPECNGVDEDCPWRAEDGKICDD